MSRKMYLKNPTRLLVAFLVVIAISACFMLLFITPAEGDSIPKYSTIIVSKGDTLWNIAKQYANKNQDIRNKIYEIQELNSINSDLKIGQELIIKVN